MSDGAATAIVLLSIFGGCITLALIIVSSLLSESNKDFDELETTAIKTSKHLRRLELIPEEPRFYWDSLKLFIKYQDGIVEAMKTAEQAARGKKLLNKVKSKKRRRRY